MLWWGDVVDEESWTEDEFLDETAQWHELGLEGRWPEPFSGIDDAFYVGLRQWSSRLKYAAVKGWVSAIGWLVDRGADVDRIGRRRIEQQCGTPLHSAAQFDRRDAAAELLDRGATLEARAVRRNARDDVSYVLTPLHDALLHGSYDVTRLLVSRGASHGACHMTFPNEADLAAKLDNGMTLRETFTDEDDIDWAEQLDRGRAIRLKQAVGQDARIASFLAAVRAAGGWQPYVDAPRAELLALRERLLDLRPPRAAPSSTVGAHAWLFLDADDDVFAAVLAFWRSDRDLYPKT